MDICRNYKKIKLGISSCLLGKAVRYDGRDKLDLYLKNDLGKFISWVGVCPEVECGLGVPREPMYLAGKKTLPRLVTVDSKIDHTDRMVKWIKRRLGQLEKEKLCGFVFKSNSPSCGLYNVLSKKGTGIFAMKFTRHFRNMPAEDNERLKAPGIRKDFIDKVYKYPSLNEK